MAAGEVPRSRAVVWVAVTMLGPSDCKPAMTPTGNQSCSVCSPSLLLPNPRDSFHIPEVPHSAVLHPAPGSCTLLSHTFNPLIFNFCLLVWAEKSTLASSVCAQCGHWEPRAPLHQPSQVWVHGHLLPHSWVSTPMVLSSCRTGVTHKLPPQHTCSLKALEVVSLYLQLPQITPRSPLSCWHEASTPSNKTALVQRAVGNKGADLTRQSLRASDNISLKTLLFSHLKMKIDQIYGGLVVHWAFQQAGEGRRCGQTAKICTGLAHFEDIMWKEREWGGRNHLFGSWMGFNLCPVSLLEHCQNAFCLDRLP